MKLHLNFRIWNVLLIDRLFWNAFRWIKEISNISSAQNTSLFSSYINKGKGRYNGQIVGQNVLFNLGMTNL